MKTLALSVAACLLASTAFAQSTPPPGPALPPPGLHDPGVKATAPAVTPAPASAPASATQAQAATSAETPDVTVHRRGDTTVQEYRRGGQLYMVVITPRGGAPQTYMLDPQGRVVDEHGQRPQSTTMYKILEWGKSPPAAASSSGD